MYMFLMILGQLGRPSPADSRPSPADIGGVRQFATAPAAAPIATPYIPAEATPTPYAEVIRVINLLPRPKVAFVEYGCGAEARWTIAAAQQWNCKSIGIEIDASRANAARQRVELLGLDHLIVILEGDATKADIQADVGVAYLYESTLLALKPKLEKLTAFASYLHQPPELPVIQNGATWIYTKPGTIPTAVWNGQLFTHPPCDNPNCGMCVSIRSQLAVAPKGHYETRQLCQGRGRPCILINVWVQD